VRSCVPFSVLCRLMGVLTSERALSCRFSDSPAHELPNLFSSALFETGYPTQCCFVFFRLPRKWLLAFFPSCLTTAVWRYFFSPRLTRRTVRSVSLNSLNPPIPPYLVLFPPHPLFPLPRNRPAPGLFYLGAGWVSWSFASFGHCYSLCLLPVLLWPALKSSLACYFLFSQFAPGSTALRIFSVFFGG